MLRQQTGVYVLKRIIYGKFQNIQAHAPLRRVSPNGMHSEIRVYILCVYGTENYVHGYTFSLNS